jgi:hypothetical protein
MDQSLLVNVDIQRGADIVAALDRSNIKVSVALFAVLSEYGDWRMVLGARAFDEHGITDAYGLLFRTLSAAGIGPEKLPIILIFSMKEPLIRDLRRRFAKTKNVEGMRLGGQLIGGRFIEDGYVYRIR